jgi:hypothetical protein
MFAGRTLQARPAGAAPLPQAAPASRARPNPVWSRLVQRDPASDPQRQEALQERDKFLAGAPYFLHNNRPSTGRGIFDAMYYPDQLKITVKLRFRFLDSHPSDYPSASRDEITWKPAEKETWRKRFMTEVAAKWNSAGFVLYCTRPYWEELRAKVVTSFVDVNHFEDNPDPKSEDRQNNPARLPIESDKYDSKGKLVKAGDVPPDFDLVVHKVPKGETTLNTVTSTRVGVGYGSFDSQDLEKGKEEGGFSRRTAVHEAGHMFGLGDTYQPVGDDKKPIEGYVPPHSALAQKELGKAVPAKDDQRIMSLGEKFDLSDAVTFLEAIRRATRIDDWSLEPKMKKLPPRYDDGVPHPAGTSADTRVA